MIELLKWTLSVWKLYWNEGFYQYLLLLSVLYLLLFKRKKESTRQILPFLFIILFIFFCPFTAAVIRKCIGTEVYWRVLWLVPLVPVISLAGTELIRSLPSKILQPVLALVFVAVIALSGKGMMQAGQYQKFANRQKVPNEVAYCCNLINEKATEYGYEEIRVAADDYLSSYIRVYDPSILMPYGRGGTGALKRWELFLHDQIESEKPTYKRIAKAALHSSCNFLILPDRGLNDKKIHKVLGSFGFQDIGNAGTYTIYQLIPSEET